MPQGLSACHYAAIIAGSPLYARYEYKRTPPQPYGCGGVYIYSVLSTVRKPVAEGILKEPKAPSRYLRYAGILARKKKNYSEYRTGKNEMRNYLMAQKILETMFGEKHHTIL